MHIYHLRNDKVIAPFHIPICIRIKRKKRKKQLVDSILLTGQTLPDIEWNEKKKKYSPRSMFPTFHCWTNEIVRNVRKYSWSSCVKDKQRSLLLILGDFSPRKKKNRVLRNYRRKDSPFPWERVNFPPDATRRKHGAEWIKSGARSRKIRHNNPVRNLATNLISADLFAWITWEIPRGVIGEG